jgi:hypothetical protein
MDQGLMAHTCNSRMWEAKAGGLRVQGHPGLQSNTLSQKKNKNIQKEHMRF